MQSACTLSSDQRCLGVILSVSICTPCDLTANECQKYGKAHLRAFAISQFFRWLYLPPHPSGARGPWEGRGGYGPIIVSSLGPQIGLPLSGSDNRTCNTWML